MLTQGSKRICASAKSIFLLQTVSLNLTCSLTRCSCWPFACVSLVFNYGIRSTEKQEKSILSYANAHAYTHETVAHYLKHAHTRKHQGERKLHTLARTPCSRWKVCHLRAVQGVNKNHFPQHRFGSPEVFMINISHQHYITAARSSTLPFLNIYVLKNPTAHSEYRLESERKSNSCLELCEICQHHLSNKRVAPSNSQLS